MNIVRKANIIVWTTVAVMALCGAYSPKAGADTYSDTVTSCIEDLAFYEGDYFNGQSFDMGDDAVACLMDVDTPEAIALVSVADVAFVVREAVDAEVLS